MEKFYGSEVRDMENARCCRYCKHVEYYSMDSEPDPIVLCTVDKEYEPEIVLETLVCDSFERNWEE